MDINKLRELLEFDGESGLFRWRVKRKKASPGSVAGAINGKGYRYISFDNVSYRANRLAWFYAFGKWPAGQIDHINGNRDDNRLANLRDVTGRANSQNRLGANKNNSVRLLGVCYRPKTEKWKAQISVGGRSIHLGYFLTAEEAQAAYMRAKSSMHVA